MMTGIPLIIMFVVAVVAMIVAISKFKIHPFLSIMAVSLFFAFVAGVPLKEIPGTIGSGFSGTFTSIGIVIILGALTGILLEKTGAALKMADVVVKLVGKKNPDLAILIMGWIVSIPVFCDSGFVILNPIRKALVKRTQVSSVAMTVALSMGLYISHCFIPPTPGPIAAANLLGIGNEMLLVIGLGMLLSIPPLIAGYIFARYIGKRVKSKDELAEASGEPVKTYEELLKEYGQLPGAVMSFAPIVVPILLMGIASAFSMAKMDVPLIAFLGTPIIALAVAVILGVILLAQAGKMSEFYNMTNETLMVVGPILFVTAAGGVLGKVISVSGMVQFITEHSNVLETVGIFFPFLLSSSRSFSPRYSRRLRARPRSRLRRPPVCSPPCFRPSASTLRCSPPSA